MSRITHVELDGFKSQFRRYELGPLTLLSGPNGTGKSSILEGLRYALSGEVPSGKVLDEVSKYFPPRGGAVLVIDADGNWVRRGITRDHEKAKVSTELEEEGDAEWHANDALLDMRGFLALSPNKRREFVLELVGAGETPKDAEVHAALARDYARQIGGPGADVTLLDGRREDLPEDVALLADRWGAIWSVLSSYLKTGDPTASAIFQRLSDASRERKNAARVAGAEARSAIRELEAAAKGAEAAAADLDDRRLAAEAAQESLSAIREAAAGRREIETALARNDAELGDCATRLEDLEGRVALLAKPAPRPGAPNGADERALELARRDRDALREKLGELNAAERDAEAARGELEAARAEFLRVTSEPVGRLVVAADDVRELDGAEGALGRLLGRLLDMVDEFAASWRDRKDAAVRWMEAATDHAHGRETRRAELAKATPSAKPYDELMDACRELEVAAIARRKAHDSVLASWEAGERLRSEVLATQAEARKRHQAARVRGDDLSARLAAIPVPDVTAAGERLRAATEALRTAEEAAGALKAYRDAVARAESEQVAEKAWKAAEAACKRARETYVADVVRPLVDDVAGLLAAAGRSERVYLELENERGKPVFDLGWVSGDSRRSLSALSGGEAVLFCAALAVTIAKRSSGRKVLLIEADPLDEANLARLLSALGKMNVELDACVLATSTEVDESALFGQDDFGWRVIHFVEEATKR